MTFICNFCTFGIEFCRYGYALVMGAAAKKRGAYSASYNQGYVVKMLGVSIQQ